MTYTLTVTDHPADTRDSGLGELANAVHQITAVVADHYGIPDIHVDLIFADDFIGATQDALDEARRDGEAPDTFTTERLGGETVAKNVPRADDFSDIAIVMNRTLLAADGEAVAHTIFLIAHELFHPMLNRRRHQSGTLEGVIYPSRTPNEIARSIACTITDEYRADQFASVMLGHFGTITTPGGGTEQLHAGHVFGDGYNQQFTDLLDTHIAPGWPDLVMDYRYGRVGLDDMWRAIASQTDQTFTLLAHAQAVADAARADGPLDGDNGSHRGATLYIAPAWSAVMSALDEHKTLGTPEEFALGDVAIADTVERELFDMWARLGLTFSVNKERNFAIHVTNPQR
ncbi:hypothetical protein GCM10009641_46880 [Mycobacterium cookii]|jgi:hypothetical protein|uniref:Uncharacterized protein n=1 Tax=Nocardioides furvisabuli TaxID=375542 RepID=A0ABP5JDA2_9ACTN|nr:hypothetical protein [Nocardioides furvisabuli]